MPATGIAEKRQRLRILLEEDWGEELSCARNGKLAEEEPADRGRCREEEEWLFASA